MVVGYTCYKNSLLFLNMLYVMVSFLLIGVATYGQTSSRIASLPILGGIVASGVFLLFVSVFGLYATYKHSQVLLFVYMMVMLLIFIIQFVVACTALSVNKQKELKIAEAAWNNSDNSTKFDVERYFGCCGYKNGTSEGVNCSEIPECLKGQCSTCRSVIGERINTAFRASGGLGLFFAFTEFVSVVVAYQFRRHAAQLTAL